MINEEDEIQYDSHGLGQITYSIREKTPTGLNINPEMQFKIKEGDNETGWYSVQMILDAVDNFGEEMHDRYKSDRNYHNTETQVILSGFAKDIGNGKTI